MCDNENIKNISECYEDKFKWNFLDFLEKKI